jgi:hypothetical protein
MKPVARNTSAIRAFHDLDFRPLGHLQLVMRLNQDGGDWNPGPEVHGRSLDC